MLLLMFYRKDDRQYKEPDLQVIRTQIKSKSNLKWISNEGLNSNQIHGQEFGSKSTKIDTQIQCN